MDIRVLEDCLRENIGLASSHRLMSFPYIVSMVFKKPCLMSAPNVFFVVMSRVRRSWLTEPGDITFKDAYEKTGRVLNISVNAEKRNDIPQLLNYLTAPNVVSLVVVAHTDIHQPANAHSLYTRQTGVSCLFSCCTHFPYWNQLLIWERADTWIREWHMRMVLMLLQLVWSAACASCALSGLFEPVKLMAKNSKGELMVYHPSGLQFNAHFLLSPKKFIWTKVL